MMTFGNVLGTFDWNNDHLMIGNEHWDTRHQFQTLLITRPSFINYLCNPQFHILIPNAGSKDQSQY